jgi:hypothetical protein
VANTFKNAGTTIGTSNTTLYTAPSSTTSVIHAIYISNIHATGDATVEVLVTDTSAGTDFYIAKNVDVINGSTLILDKPVNLEATDVLKAKSSVGSSLEAFLSILEIT